MVERLEVKIGDYKVLVNAKMQNSKQLKELIPLLKYATSLERKYVGLKYEGYYLILLESEFILLTDEDIDKDSFLSTVQILEVSDDELEEFRDNKKKLIILLSGITLVLTVLILSYLLLSGDEELNHYSQQPPVGNLQASQVNQPLTNEEKKSLLIASAKIIAKRFYEIVVENMKDGKAILYEFKADSNIENREAKSTVFVRLGYDYPVSNSKIGEDNLYFRVIEDRISLSLDNLSSIVVKNMSAGNCLSGLLFNIKETKIEERRDGEVLITLTTNTVKINKVLEVVSLCPVSIESIAVTRENLSARLVLHL